jgi:hypothetical protein
MGDKRRIEDSDPHYVPIGGSRSPGLTVCDPIILTNRVLYTDPLLANPVLLDPGLSLCLSLWPQENTDISARHFINLLNIAFERFVPLLELCAGN